MIPATCAGTAAETREHWAWSEWAWMTGPGANITLGGHVKRVSVVIAVF